VGSKCRQCRQCSRSIHFLTCSDLLLSLSPLGSHPPSYIRWIPPASSANDGRFPPHEGSAGITVSEMRAAIQAAYNLKSGIGSCEVTCSYCTHTVLILILYSSSYCTHTVLILILYSCSYCTHAHTVLILILYSSSYCTHPRTVLILILYSCSYCTHTHTVLIMQVTSFASVDTTGDGNAGTVHHTPYTHTLIHHTPYTIHHTPCTMHPMHHAPYTNHVGAAADAVGVDTTGDGQVLLIVCTHTVHILHSYCAHTVLTILHTHTLLCSYSTVLLLYCTHTLLYSCSTVLILYSYCTHTVLILYSTHTVLILYSYCTHTLLYSYSGDGQVESVWVGEVCVR
jgi:hypothetical protein